MYGNAILSRYPITPSGNARLHRSEGEEQRGLLRAVVDVPAPDLEVVNTHLSATSAADHAHQTTQIRELIGTPGRPYGPARGPQRHAKSARDPDPERVLERLLDRHW